MIHTAKQSSGDLRILPHRADLAGHGDTSFLERTYCHPQMQRKQAAAKRRAECLFPVRRAEPLVS